MAAESIKKDDVLVTDVLIPEAYLVGLFWSNPELYDFYGEEKVHGKTFGNPIWSYYFGLGRWMRNKGINIFDDISVKSAVDESKTRAHYEKHGEYKSIAEIIDEVKDKQDNFDGYFDTVLKYNMLRGLRGLFGDTVMKRTDKYDYRQLSMAKLHQYWMDKVNILGMTSKNVEEQYLLENLDEAIERWDSKPDIGLPLHNSPMMTEITTGWSFGHVFIYGAFGGKGKTSQMFNKIVMSCIKNKEKLLIVANEQGLDEFQKLLFITAFGMMNIEFNRQRLNKGGFTEEEKKHLQRAKAYIAKIVDQANNPKATKLIAFAFLEDYNIDSLKTTIRHYANRGYKRIVIDTAEPTEGSGDMPRWERFTEDFKQIYKLARPNGGGLNLAIWTNVQLSDSSLGRRFLDEHSLGDSKKIKNKASVVFLGRNVWDDEMEGGDHELTVRVTAMVKDGFNIESGEVKMVPRTYEKKLDKEDGQYYLIFTSKNRRGMDNSTGLDVLVLKPDFNNNTWIEVGWTTVFRDRNYS